MDDRDEIETWVQARQVIFPEPEMIATSVLMKAVVLRLRRAALIEDFPVLLTGESGVGKKEAALFLHRTSAAVRQQRKTPFVEVNCAAITESLIESELFGHERGSFTGATERKLGQLEVADGGSLLLDEIGHASLGVQQSLLKFLEDGLVTRVGATASVQVKTRVIAATHRNLREEIAAGRFREDLYYRLNVFPIHIPPLRERKEELKALVLSHIRRFNSDHSTTVVERVDADVVSKLGERAWRGNIRELFNVVSRAIVNREGQGQLQVSDFEFDEQAGAMALADGSGLPRAGDPVTLEFMERAHIAETLAHCNWNKHQAAKVLGLHRPTLYSKMKKYGINTP